MRLETLKLRVFTQFMFALLFLVASLSSANARETKPAPAIWKIDGAQSDIYFFGSFHILPKDLVWRTAELDAALQSAQQLDFEINIDDAQNPLKMTTLIQQHGFLPAGESLRKMLAIEYRVKLEAAAIELGLPIQALDRMRPWLVALTITSLSAMKQTTKPGEKVNPAAATGEQAGADIHLWNWAKANNKERGTLETLESQIQIFADLSREQELQYLVMTLQQTEKLDESLNILLNAWVTGDTKKLDKSLNGEMDAFPAMRKALFDERHKKWMPQIEAMLNDGKTHVIIVGAAHLVGKGSVIDLLRAKGIKVEGP